MVQKWCRSGKRQCKVLCGDDIFGVSPRDMSRGETPKMSSPHKTLHCLFPLLHHFCTISGAVPFQRSCLRTTYFRVPVTILSRDMSRGETPKMSSPHKTLHCLFPFWGPIGPVDERPDSLRAPLLFQIRVHSRLFAVKHRHPPPRLNPDKTA